MDKFNLNVRIKVRAQKGKELLTRYVKIEIK